MLCSTKTNIVLLKICLMKNALRSQPEKCRAERPPRPRCSVAGDELALHLVGCPGLGAHRAGVVDSVSCTQTVSLLALLTCPFCDSGLLCDIPCRFLVTPMPHARPGPVSLSWGKSAGQQCRGRSEPELADCILENPMVCVFFPCNLTLGRDPLTGAASGERLAGILLGVVLVRWHCPRQGTEDAQGGGGQAHHLAHPPPGGPGLTCFSQRARPCRPCEWGGRGEPWCSDGLHG